ncbi:MAG: FAD-dependent oxidoreductase [Chlamydiota bacterium]
MSRKDTLLDVIIIGGGYTGLSCALTLQKNKKSFLLLEASDHVGGRALDRVINNDFRLELGGQYIAPIQNRVTQMVKDVGLQTYPAWGEGDNFLLYENKIGRYQDSPTKCLGSLLQDKLVQAEIEKALALLSNMFKEISPTAPWESGNGEAWDAMTFQTWLDSVLTTSPAKQFFRFMTNQGFSTEPEQISLLQMLWFFKTSHGLPPWAIGGGQANRVDGGTGLLALKMAERFQEQIRCNEPVLKILQDDDFVFIQTEKNVYKAKAAVVCIPPQLISSIRYEPSLPPDLHRSFAALQTGNSMKVQAVYKKPFWRDKKFSGNGLSYTGIPTFTYDNSKKDGSLGVLLGFIAAGHATKWNQKPQEVRKEAVLNTWASIFGEEALHPIDYIEQDWLQEPYIRGGHGCHFPPGVWKELGPSLGKEKMPQFKKVTFAASDIAKDWNGYLEGALYAGEQAAMESTLK